MIATFIATVLLISETPQLSERFLLCATNDAALVLDRTANTVASFEIPLAPKTQPARSKWTKHLKGATILGGSIVKGQSIVLTLESDDHFVLRKFDKGGILVQILVGPKSLVASKSLAGAKVIPLEDGFLVGLVSSKLKQGVRAHTVGVSTANGLLTAMKLDRTLPIGTPTASRELEGVLAAETKGGESYTEVFRTLKGFAVGGVKLPSTNHHDQSPTCLVSTTDDKELCWLSQNRTGGWNYVIQRGKKRIGSGATGLKYGQLAYRESLPLIYVSKGFFAAVNANGAFACKRLSSSLALATGLPIEIIP